MSHDPSPYMDTAVIFMLLNKLFISVILVFFIPDGAFVSYYKQTGEQKSLGKHKAEWNVSLAESTCITATIKVPPFCREEAQVWPELHRSNRCIWVAPYSLALFFKCRSLITLPTGISAAMWEHCAAACCWHFNRLDIAAAFLQTSTTGPLLMWVSGTGMRPLSNTSLWTCVVDNGLMIKNDKTELFN